VSHFTTIETQIRDINALTGACQEMGFVLVGNTEARGYGGNHHKGDYVIRLKGPYDIAVNLRQDGSYGLTTDWWGGHVGKEVGPAYGRLLQLYGVHKAGIEARRKGHTVRRQSMRDGSIKLVIGGV